MTRGIVALAVLLAVTTAWAQAPDRGSRDDFRWNGADSRQERLERIQRARQERRERREEARQQRRERMERLQERFRGDGVHLRVLRNYRLAEGQTTSEPVVVIGGSARIDGHVADDVLVVGGGLNLGPKAVIEGNAVSVLGEVTLEPGASVQGSIDEAVLPWPGIDIGGFNWGNEVWWRQVSFWGSFVRLSFTLAVAVVLTLVAPGWIGTISGRSAGASILAGLAVEVLFVPALAVLTVALIVSIIGIPLLAGVPVLVAALAFLWVAGFTAVAGRIGRAFRGRSAATELSVLDVLIGYTMIVAVTVLGQLMAVSLDWLSPMTSPMKSAGLIIEYLAWTIGLGAAVTTLFASRRVVLPPVAV